MFPLTRASHFGHLFLTHSHVLQVRLVRRPVEVGPCHQTNIRRSPRLQDCKHQYSHARRGLASELQLRIGEVQKNVNSFHRYVPFRCVKHEMASFWGALNIPRKSFEESIYDLQGWVKVGDSTTLERQECCREVTLVKKHLQWGSKGIVRMRETRSSKRVKPKRLQLNSSTKPLFRSLIRVL